MNSEEQDEIVKMFLESDILPQLETMDISAGVLKDEGAQLLLDNMDKIAHLKFINMRYNYLSKGMKKKLQELPMKIDIAESEEEMCIRDRVNDTDQRVQCLKSV